MVAVAGLDQVQIGFRRRRRTAARAAALRQHVSPSGPTEQRASPSDGRLRSRAPAPGRADLRGAKPIRIRVVLAGCAAATAEAPSGRCWVLLSFKRPQREEADLRLELAPL